MQIINNMGDCNMYSLHIAKEIIICGFISFSLSIFYYKLSFGAKKA